MMIRDSAKRKALAEEQRYADALRDQVVTQAGGQPGDGDYRALARAGGFQPTTLESLVQQQYWPLSVSAQVAEALGHESLEAATAGGGT